MDKYKAIKKELRTAVAKERQQTMATGGGQAPARNPILDVPEFVELLEIIRFSATGRPAAYDADDLQHTSTNESDSMPIDSMPIIYVASNEEVITSECGDDFNGFPLESPIFEELDSLPIAEPEPEPKPSTSKMELGSVPIAETEPKPSTSESQNIKCNIPLQADATDTKAPQPIGPREAKWNKFSGALLRNPVSSPLKRRNPFAAESKQQQLPVVDYKRNYFEEQSVLAHERHAKQMELLGKQNALADLKIQLAKNKLKDAAECQRLRMKNLKSQLASNRRGEEASEPSTGSTDDDDDFIPATP